MFCGALPEQGLGIALKCDDGAARAAEVAMAAMIARFLPMSDEERRALDRFLRPTLAQLEWDRGGWIEGERNSAVIPGDRRETRDP